MIDRLEAATAGSVELDRETFKALGGYWIRITGNKQGQAAVYDALWEDGTPVQAGMCLTRSLNDMVGECERRGLDWEVFRAGDGYNACVEFEVAHAATPALALATALVRHVQETAK